jgi:hypothetical protein
MLEPDSKTVPRGGTLGYTVTAVNNTSTIQTFQYWTDVTLPNGSKLPLVPPLTVTLGPSASRSAHLSHPVPIGAPLGTYTYNAFVGPYPTIWDEDHFDFTVTTSLKKEGAKDWGTTIDQGFGK